jgi:hypothetical protein
MACVIKKGVPLVQNDRMHLRERKREREIERHKTEGRQISRIASNSLSLCLPCIVPFNILSLSDAFYQIEPETVSLSLITQATDWLKKRLRVCVYGESYSYLA